MVQFFLVFIHIGVCVVALMFGGVSIEPLGVWPAGRPVCHQLLFLFRE
jgi:hypothetical protein